MSVMSGTIIWIERREPIDIGTQWTFDRKIRTRAALDTPAMESVGSDRVGHGQFALAISAIWAAPTSTCAQLSTVLTMQVKSDSGP